MDQEIAFVDFLRNGTSVELFANLYQNRCQDLTFHIYDDFLHDPVIFGKALAMVLLSLAIIIGNLLVILSILISNRLRTVTNFFIASLAVSDFVIGVGVLPFSFAQDLLGVWIFGYPWCRIWLALDVWVSTASIYNLVVIALDRYVGITRPLSYRSLVTPKRAALAVCGAWIWSFLVSFPPMVTFQNNVQVTSDERVGEDLESLIDCQCTALDNSTSYILFSASSSFYLPFIALLYIYIKIYVKIRRATAAVDKGYMTLKKKQLCAVDSQAIKEQPTNRLQQNNNNTTKTDRNRIYLSTSPSTRLTLKKKLEHEKRSQSSQSMINGGVISPESSNLETIALRVHRGRYNPAGAGNSGQDLKSDKITRNCTFSVSPLLSHAGTAKPNSHRPAYHSQDFDKVDSIGKDDAADGDRRITECIRRLSQKNRNIADYKSIVDRFIDRDRSSSSLIGPKSNQVNSERYLLEIRRESGTAVFESQGDSVVGGRPKTKVRHRQRFHDRYDKKLKREVRAAKTVALVTGCFFLCWSGFCVVYTMKALPFCQLEEEAIGEKSESAVPGEEASCVPSLVFTIVLWLGYTNSALNPLIYAVCNRQFLLTFKRILCCRFCAGHRSNTNDECQWLFRKRLGHETVKRQIEVNQSTCDNSTTRICGGGSVGASNPLNSTSDGDMAGV